MISNIFNLVLYKPLYNVFIAFIGTFPWVDAGLVVILFTLIIKLILFPLSQKSIKSQLALKELQPKINEIKIKYKDNKQEEALKTMSLYKESGINPFAGIFLTLIQLPILIALYMVFNKGGLTNINMESLYSFVKVPEQINTIFLGLFDITKKNTTLAVLVALGQYLQIKYTMPAVKKTEKQNKDNSFQGELARNMSMQMKYVMPVFMFFIARSFVSMVSLYFITSSVFAIIQELYMRRKIKR